VQLTLQGKCTLGGEWWVSIRPEKRGADSKPTLRKPLVRNLPRQARSNRWLKWKMENERWKMENAFLIPIHFRLIRLTNEALLN